MEHGLEKIRERRKLISFRSLFDIKTADEEDTFVYNEGVRFLKGNINEHGGGRPDKSASTGR